MCGAGFESARRAKYCGERCKKRQQRGTLQPTVRECPVCHGSFTATHATKYCSDECRMKVRSKRDHGNKRTGSCAQCGAPMWVSRSSLPQGQATCLECRRARYAGADGQELRRAKAREAQAASRQRRRAEGRLKPSRPPKPPQQWNCAVCGILVIAKPKSKSRGKYCPEHAHAIANLAKGHRRRAAKYGVTYEWTDPRKVYDRDGWICGLCDEPVDPDLVYPDPMSASLDHVIPMSLGGPHHLDNLQCSHWLCNVQKSNRYDASKQATGTANNPRPDAPTATKPQVDAA